MNLQRYLQNKAAAVSDQSHAPPRCLRCGQAAVTCFCATISSFTPTLQIVLLQHPDEFKRRIATGRMAHVLMNNSRLIVGENFSEDAQVNRLLADPSKKKVVLYPGDQATNLSGQSLLERRCTLPENSLVFVVDGTWRNVRKMMRLSQNLQRLTQISFTSPSPSNFVVRRPPRAEYLATIEAIHHLLELMTPPESANAKSRPHDRLLSAFAQMLNHQLSFQRQ